MVDAAADGIRIGRASAFTVDLASRKCIAMSKAKKLFRATMPAEGNGNDRRFGLAGWTRGMNRRNQEEGGSKKEAEGKSCQAPLEIFGSLEPILIGLVLRMKMINRSRGSAPRGPIYIDPSIYGSINHRWILPLSTHSSQPFIQARNGNSHLVYGTPIYSPHLLSLPPVPPPLTSQRVAQHRVASHGPFWYVPHGIFHVAPHHITSHRMSGQVQPDLIHAQPANEISN